MRGRWFDMVHFLQNLTSMGSRYCPITSLFVISMDLLNWDLVQCTFKVIYDNLAFGRGHIVVKRQRNRSAGDPFGYREVSLLEAKPFPIQRLKMDRREIVVGPHALAPHIL